MSNWRRPRKTSNRTPPTVEDRLRAIVADVPKEEWDRLPADLSDNLDHYVYGTPKSRMNAMDAEGIEDVSTSDHHFRQDGLLRVD